MLADTDLAYMAGLLDGEGCIVIDKTAHRNGRTYYSLRVTFVNTHLPTIQWVSDNFCDHSWVVKEEAKPNRKALYTIIWRSTQAQTLLATLLPFMRTKRQQAEWAIEFQQALPPKGKAKTTSDDDLAWRASIREWISQLNHS